MGSISNTYLKYVFEIQNTILYLDTFEKKI